MNTEEPLLFKLILLGNSLFINFLTYQILVFLLLELNQD